METKAMTLRLSAEQTEELQLLAQVEGVSVAEKIREAIAEHIERKLKDEPFQKRLRETMERNQAILKRLGAG